MFDFDAIGFALSCQLGVFGGSSRNGVFAIPNFAVGFETPLAAFQL